ncbi:hypothetical protein MFIFM68171_09880 [Madurella fahalii]|uniref:Uncharacterized protein n=1 Tax=Madurella fahalii TaxID=1157608 RepID=A0ABQ0GPK4_9PEZI
MGSIPCIIARRIRPAVESGRVTSAALSDWCSDPFNRVPRGLFALILALDRLPGECMTSVTPAPSGA